MRLLICRHSATAAIHAIKPQTGEKVWGYVAAKRAVNTGVVVTGNTVIVSHGDENLDTSELGMIAAIDGSQTGDIKTTKWAIKGDQFGFSSPVIDGTRVYQIDNGSRLKAFDLETGRELWRQPLGTVQKAPPVLADGKMYVGTESGKFFIVRPHADAREILSEVELPHSRTTTPDSRRASPEPVFGGAADFARPHFLRVDRRRLRDRPEGGEGADRLRRRRAGRSRRGRAGPCAGRADRTGAEARADGEAAREAVRREGTVPARGDRRRRGRSQGLKGTVADGTFTVAAEPVEQAGTIKATVGALTGEARARVVRPLPWTETFDAIRGRRGAARLDQRRRRQDVRGHARRPEGADRRRPTTRSSSASARSSARWTGPTTPFEADVRGATRRRQMADIGVTAQRYSLVLYGNEQQLKIEPWEPETARSVTVPFAWKADTWYHLKLRVENMPTARSARAARRGRVGQPEPAAWMIDKIDPIGNRQGAPGFFIDAEFGAYLDNLKVTANQ